MTTVTRGIVWYVGLNPVACHSSSWVRSTLPRIIVAVMRKQPTLGKNLAVNLTISNIISIDIVDVYWLHRSLIYSCVDHIAAI